MTSYGYKFFTFSVHKRGSKSERLRLGQLMGDGPVAPEVPGSRVDAVVTIYGMLNGLLDQRIDVKTRHLTVRSVAPVGRTIRFTVDLGTSGQSSTFLDSAASTATPVFKRAEHHIESSERRGLIVAPTSSSVGMVALESRGGSTGSSQIMPLLKRGFTAHTGLIVDFDAVVHEEALQAFLAQAHIRSITLRRKGLPPDIADQLEVRSNEASLGRLEMKISRGNIPEFTRRLTTKFRRDDQARQRLLSVGDLHFSDLNVKMQVGERSTTLSISADQMPSFVYYLKLAGMPTDQHFYSEVLQMVPEVGRAFGALVGSDWQAGAWSAGSLATVVEVPKQEVSLDEGLGEATG